MHSHRSLLGLLCVCAAVARLAGCAGGAAERRPLSGEHEGQGEPRHQGAHNFLPEDPALGTSGGALIKDGRYSIPASQGLLPGRYKVTVSSADPKKAVDPNADPGAPGPVYKDRVQPKYNINTILTAEVKADGKNTFDFEVN